jgi:hypothetical protein
MTQPLEQIANDVFLQATLHHKWYYARQHIWQKLGITEQHLATLQHHFNKMPEVRRTFRLYNPDSFCGMGKYYAALEAWAQLYLEKDGKMTK